MHDGVRRLSVLMIVCCTALILTYWLRGTGKDYGLFQLLRGEIAPPPAEAVEPEPITTPSAFTPAVGPAMDLTDVKILALLSQEKANLAAAVVPSVVSIEMERPASKRTVVPSPLFDLNAVVVQREREPGQGSGAFISREGHVVTNYHVIDGAIDGTITVTTHERKQYAADIIGYDPVNDIAVLKADVESDLTFTPLGFGDSNQVRQGEMVFSVGSPFGLDGTFTDGIVSSATPRQVSDSVPPLIQTNTALSRGNSGGPLVDVQGKIVGINSAIYNDSNSFSSVGSAYGLAIPSNVVNTAVRRILSKDVPRYGYLGVYMKDIHPHEVITLGLRNAEGCLVNGSLAGSPAYQAGLRKDDVILQYDGKPFADVNELLEQIRDTDDGKEVKLTIVRSRAEKLLTAVIRPNGSVEIAEPSESLVKESWDRAGLRVDYVASSERIDLRFQPYDPMVVITDIREGSGAESQHLSEGLLIHEVNDMPVQTPREFYEVLQQSTSQVYLRISFPGRRGSVQLPIPLG
ncbi:MAG: trypsin-like peptidase domain-containing protein [Verrucomicrobiales bacterium]|nr:trypsin-like peptidase domain-containing protein [Verrucomicrobiales bacterium]